MLKPLLTTQGHPKNWLLLSCCVKECKQQTQVIQYRIVFLTTLPSSVTCFSIPFILKYNLYSLGFPQCMFSFTAPRLLSDYEDIKTQTILLKVVSYHLSVTFYPSFRFPLNSLYTIRMYRRPTTSEFPSLELTHLPNMKACLIF